FQQQQPTTTTNPALASMFANNPYASAQLDAALGMRGSFEPGSQLDILNEQTIQGLTQGTFGPEFAPSMMGSQNPNFAAVAPQTQQPQPVSGLAAMPTAATETAGLAPTGGFDTGFAPAGAFAADTGPGFGGPTFGGPSGGDITTAAAGPAGLAGAAAPAGDLTPRGGFPAPDAPGGHA